MNPDYPILTKPKPYIQYDCGAGTLSSYYESGVESQGVKRIKYDTTKHFAGPLPLFPQLDVMGGDASAVNDAYIHNWGLTSNTSSNIDISALDYEEMLGGLSGFRIHNNTGFDEAIVNQHSQHKEGELFTITGENIDKHSGQAPHGRHDIDSTIAELSQQVANQHNVGDSQEGRDRGLDRGDNPAVNASETGKGEVFENPDTVDVTAPVSVPMEVDAIEINGVVTLPMDVDVALGANQTS